MNQKSFAIFNENKNVNVVFEMFYDNLNEFLDGYISLSLSIPLKVSSC